MSKFISAEVEDSAQGWLESQGSNVKYYSNMIPRVLLSGRQDYTKFILEQFLCHSLLPKIIRGEIRIKNIERFSRENNA